MVEGGAQSDPVVGVSTVARDVGSDSVVGVPMVDGDDDDQGYGIIPQESESEETLSGQ